MSSFDFADNFSGFNDLFQRAEFLTEAKKSPYAKYHPSFGGVTKDLRSAGFSSAPLDTINFIRTALYNLELISDDELAAAKKGTGFAAKKKNLLALLDSKEDVIEQNKDKIAKEIADGLARYINRATTDRGKEEKYAAQKAALELAKDIKAGEDMGDAVEDAVGQLDAAESELADSLQMSKEDPTTFIEIKIRDAERTDDVSKIVSKYANEDGVDISGDTVQFSVDPNTPLASAVARHGIDKIETALKRDVDRISDSVVIVMAPDEDYEEGPAPIEPEGPANEYEENINEVEDAEDLSAKKARAGKDIGKPGKNFSKIAKSAGKKYGSKAAGERVAGAVLAKMRGNYEGAEEFDDFDIGPQSDENIPDDYEEVLAALIDDDKKKHAMKQLNGEDEEEAIVMQPMLESHKTDTSAYLTEQSASDKRNKKTEIKPQSFKEKYKPKTSWQLEELRRYGL
tara:strand:- start:171 stop:1538 length:1368 start_codon:yes stop_codon:yes gene_type:complete